MNTFTPKQLAIIIPARYAAERLPGKPLAEIMGKPMVQHVYERALEVPGAHTVVVATDDQRVVDTVQRFGGRCLLTASSHLTGTDRLTEVMEQIEAEVYINLQCDEPLVRPEDISMLALSMFADRMLQVGTLCHQISAHESLNPDTVKVVIASNGKALYFSRASIPYSRNISRASYLKHVGIYAYRQEVLAMYANLPQPMIEKAECLEQLRLLAAGLHIRVFEVEPTGPGVDTPASLERVRKLMTAMNS